LEYDKLKITLEIVPVYVGIRFDYRISAKVLRPYCMLDCSGGFIPCFVFKKEVAKTVFADFYAYEQTTRPGPYGTKFPVPKVVKDKNRFLQLFAPHPVFEGYFDNMFAAKRDYGRRLVGEIIKNVLPRFGIRDGGLEERLKKLDLNEFDPEHEKLD